ncbi:MAG: aa3-type cytochrome c oxidase subunit IV [Pseudomonadota bacterium]
MATSEYNHGSMEISDQENTWKGFMTASVWGSAIIMAIVAYATLTLAIGMNWMVSLILCAGAAILGGLFMGMGGTWIVTVIGLTALAVFVQIVITIAKALLG